MPATTLYMNWTGVTVTPGGSSAITVNRVTNIALPAESSLKKFYGDAVKFPIASRPTEQTRGITITSGNCALLNTVPIGTICTVVAVLNDMTNGVGSGAITVTAINAVLQSKSMGAANNEFASVSYVFDCFGGASDADPITIAVAA
jgi:hypothetical protein